MLVSVPPGVEAELSGEQRVVRDAECRLDRVPVVHGGVVLAPRRSVFAGFVGRSLVAWSEFVICGAECFGRRRESDLCFSRGASTAHEQHEEEHRNQADDVSHGPILTRRATGGQRGVVPEGTLTAGGTGDRGVFGGDILGDEERAALRELRAIGEAVLLRLGHGKHGASILYRLNPRFINVAGQCEIGSQNIIRVQWPLWRFLRDDEKFELVAHEHCHFVAIGLMGETENPHGELWKSLMAHLGYRNARDTAYLNHSAREHLADKKKKRIMATGKATIRVKDGYIFLSAPYDEHFIQELKADIPYGSRIFLKNDKQWRIDAAYADDLLSVVRKHYGEPTIVEPEEKVVVVADAEVDPYGVMLRLGSDDTVKKVYRMLAVELHPDKGGKPENMVSLNQAWEKIRKERKL